MNPQTIFIAGATGYTGRALVRLAAEAGHETIAHVRPSLSYTSRDRVFLTPENESDSTSKKAKTSRGNGGGAVVARPKTTARGLSLGGRLIARSPPGAC